MVDKKDNATCWECLGLFDNNKAVYFNAKVGKLLKIVKKKM